MRTRTFFPIFTCLLQLAAVAENRPNILWITAEDMSPALGCYGDRWAVTPHIDRFAAESVRYSHAFATAPVCSPVRSTLITGCYATSLGTHNMRSAFPLPEYVRGFPAFLREAGYYTTNNSKTDYNTSDAERLIAESWDESSDSAHWRNRKDDSQPFFSVFNLMTSHQSRSMVWPYDKFKSEVQSRLSPEQVHDPATAPLPPFYPDSPLIRREWARFYDCVTAMDAEVGTILQQLSDDGLAENTIVFFFSDHGSGMPRHKRSLLDTGLHVPLLIRFPGRWQPWSVADPGDTSDRLVSFVDLPPTVLNLAGSAIPDYMPGRPFAGAEVSPERGLVFGHRDRVDEAFDCARSVRSRQFLYVRNYMPHLSSHQPTAWPDQGEIRREISRLTNRESMTDAQWQYAGPDRPAEELYDCDQDPLNLHNLAGEPGHRNQLQKMRQQLQQQLTDTQDRGFVPEALLPGYAGRTAAETVQVSAAALARYRQNAQHVGLESSDFFANQSGTDVEWFWTGIGMLSSGVSESTEQRIMRQFAKIQRQGVPQTIEVCHALVRHRDSAPGLQYLIQATRHQDLRIVLHATRTLELLGVKARAAIPAVEDVAKRCRSILPAATTATFVQTPEQDMAMFIGFSANAFLKQFSVRR